MLRPLIKTSSGTVSPLALISPNPSDSLRNLSGIHRRLPSTSQSSTGVHPNLSKVFRNSSSFSSHSSSVGRNSLGVNRSLPLTDHCRQARRKARPNVTLSFEALTVTGTRPDSCRGCFNTDFPPLIENCGVCNTGGGARSQHVDLLMVILTTHRATDRRKAIRDTWASITRNNTANVRHVFLFGRVKVSSAKMAVTHARKIQKNKKKK